MDEDDYNRSVLGNSGIVGDFKDRYGNKDGKVVVIVVKNYIE